MGDEGEQRTSKLSPIRFHCYFELYVNKCHKKFSLKSWEDPEKAR